LYQTTRNFSWEEVRTAETGQVRKSGEQLQPTAAAICIFGLGSTFYWLWLDFLISLGYLYALVVVGYWFASRIILCQG
jgi:hypothetical protein